MYDIGAVKQFTPNNSIVVNKNNTGDKQTPYTYSEWLFNVGENVTYDKDILHQYNLYVTKWYNTKEQPITVKQRYITFLKNIALNFSSDEEKRFIQNIDYNNVFHLESTLPKFAEKLKQIALYYANARESVKQTGKYNTLSTKKSIESYIFTKLTVLVEELLFKGNTKLLSEFTQDLASVTLLDLYETPLDRDVETFDFDPALFYDEDVAVQNLLEECVPVLEISNDFQIGISSEIEITDENISLLTPENFINYEKSKNTLNIFSDREFVESISTYNVSILSGGKITNLFEANNTLDLYDRKLPNSAVKPNKTKRNKYQLGRLGVPDNLSILTYYSHNHEIQSVEGGVDGTVLMSGEQFVSGKELDKLNLTLQITEDLSWVKAPDGNERMSGQIINSKMLPKFYGYRSTEEVQLHNNYGVSRSSDSLDFFTGEDHHTWANPDVFPIKGINTYQIDERQESLLVGDETVVQWQTDIYGNEYALFKKVEPRRGVGDYITGESSQTYAVAAGCQTYDGGEGFSDREPMWTPGITYNILDGGRHPFLDPKPEQERFPTPFPDLRRNRITPQFTIEKEPYTTWYYGPPPGQPVDEFTVADALQPVIYHGFISDGLQPFYDEQAYGGMFTDTTCGVIDPTEYDCRILDSYAFANYADSLSAITIYGEESLYISSHKLKNSDSYVEYINEGFDNNRWLTADLSGVDVGVDFSGDGGDDIYTFEGGVMDGVDFASSVCHAAIPEFEVNIDRSIPYYDLQPAIALTRAIPSEDTFQKLTQYQQNRSATGRLVFRPATSSRTVDLSRIIWSDNMLQNTGGGRGEFFDMVNNNQIVDFRVCHDVIVLQTEKYIYIQKLMFNNDNEIIPNSSFNEILQLTTDDNNQCETAIRPYFDDDKYELIWGMTRSVGEQNTCVEPVIFCTDLNNLNTVQLNVESSTEYDLSGTELDGFVYEHVDTPIISYNKMSDVYTLSYTCKLSGGDDVCHGIMVVDYANTRPVFKTLDVTLNNTNKVARHVNTLESWRRKRVSRHIRLPNNVPRPYATVQGNIEMIEPVDYSTNESSRCIIHSSNDHLASVGDEIVIFGVKGIDEVNREHVITRVIDSQTFETDVHYPLPYYDAAGELALGYEGEGEYTNKRWTDTSYNVSVSAIDGIIYNSAELQLTIDCARLPVRNNGPKINQIIFDADDGTPLQYFSRNILTGLEALDFDITELPDQSDFGDPRRHDIVHDYKFDHTERTTYHASLTAVYSNYSKLVVNVNVEADPYTVETAFDNIRLIDSVTFPDRTGASKQLLTIETENPRYNTYHMLDKATYNNSNIVGYVGDIRYAGTYHIMNDGTLMTGVDHHPGSRIIHEKPDVNPQNLELVPASTSGVVPASNY